MAPTSRTQSTILRHDSAISTEQPKPASKHSFQHKLCQLWRQYGPPAWRHKKKKATLHECVACMEKQTRKQMIVLERHACKHAYCGDCFGTLVEVACRSEGTFPPKCCGQKIPFATIKARVCEQIVEKYREMNRLCKIPPNKRWYCPYSDCGVLQSDRESSGSDVRTMKCHKCSRRICRKCKKEVWSNRLQVHICEEAAEMDEAVRKLMKEWKSCPRCGQLIDVDAGCRHVYCVCGHEYCYECLVPYALSYTGMISECAAPEKCCKDFVARKQRAREIRKHAHLEYIEEEDPPLDLPDDEDILQQIANVGDTDTELVAAILASRDDERQRQLDLLEDTRRQADVVVNNASTPQQRYDAAEVVADLNRGIDRQIEANGDWFASGLASSLTADIEDGNFALAVAMSTGV